MFPRKKRTNQQQINNPKPVSKGPGATRSKLSLLSLESRLMFDAAAAATAAEVNQEQVAQEQAESAVSNDNASGSESQASIESQELLQALTNYSPGEAPTEVAFVDPTVPDYQSLIAGMGPHVQIVMLDGGQDGMEQIAASLTGQTGIDAIHIISHGTQGQLTLGTGTLTHTSMTGQYADELAVIRQSLSESADILVYGCDFAEGQAGQDAATLLSQLTGADVAASIDDTGFAGFGGDWDFELQTGIIETHVAISYDTQADWVGLLSLTASGSETMINTTTSGTQTHNSLGNTYTPDSVAMDANGNFVSVWESAGDIYGQRYNSAGTAQGSEFVIANNAANERLASVAMNASGAFVVTWERDQGTGDTDIYARMYTASGTAVGGEFLVNETTAYDQELAKVAMAADGSFVVVWDSNTEASGSYYDDVYAQRYDATGTKIGSNFKVNTTTTWDQDHADIAMDSSGNFVVVWGGERAGAPGTYSIFGQRYNAMGVAQGGEFLVNSTASDTDRYASVAMNDSGNFVVTWNGESGSDSDIHAQRFNSAGVAQGSAIAVTNTTSYWQELSNVAMDGGGNFVVSWSSQYQDGGLWGIYSRQYDSTGVALTTESQTATTTLDRQDYSSIAYQNGKVVVTWSGAGTGDTTGIFMQRYDAAGGNAAPAITSNGGGLTAALSVAENTTAVTTVTATDADAGLPLIYSISGGADAAKFTINSSTGALSFITAPNYESPTDSGGNNVYDVMVTVKDGNGGADSQSIAVTVTAVNEAPINTVPGAQTTNEDTNLVFSSANGNQIAIQDPDNSGSPFEVTVSVTNGTLTLASTSGLTFVTGDGTTDSTMTFRGTVTNINAALNGLNYIPTANYNGGTTLTLVTKDSTLVSLEIDTNLQARYTFEGNANDVAPGTAQNGTLNGNATYVTDGTRGQVLSLDGVGDNVQIAGLFGTPANVTLAAWVNLTVADSLGSHVISLGDSVLLTVDEPSGGNGVAGVYYNGSTWVKLTTGQFIAGTGWHHVAYIFDDTNNTNTIYIDGVAVTTATASTSISYTQGANSFIGQHGNGNTAFDFAGKIDDARVYNRALTAAEIANLANDLSLIDTDSVALAVNAVNDAPTVGGGNVPAITEDTINPPGATISSMIGGTFSDPDAGASLAGILITHNPENTTQGTWQYSTNGGTNWYNVGTIAYPNALALAGTTSIRFVPAADYNGSPDVLSFRGVDNTYAGGFTSGATKVTADASSPGGTSPISSSLVSFGTTITAVNDAPTITSLSGDSLSYGEGAGVVVIEQGGNAVVADVDSANLDTGTLTVSIPSGGDSAEDILSIRHQGSGAGQIGVSGSTISYGGVTIGTFTGGSSGSALVITLNSNATPTVVTALVKNITYQNTDTNAPTTGARTVRFVLTDGDGGTSANYDTTVTVSGVNDAPINTVPGAQTTNEDTNLVFSSGNSNQISIQDPDGSGSPFEVTVSVTNGTLTLASTSGLTFVMGDGTNDSTITMRGTVTNINAALNGLTYIPTSNYNGGAVLTFSTLDSTLLSLKTDANLQGWYEFSGNANDTSPGTAQHATLFNGAVIATDGTRGQVLSLDGVDDYADLSASTADYAGFTQGTISGWIKATGTFETIFSISDTADTGSYASLFLGANGYLTYEVMENGVMQLAVYKSDLAINDGNWHHVAVTVGASGNHLYVDGQLATAGQLIYDTGNATTQHFFSSVTSLDSMAMGRNQDSGGGKWYATGSLDSVGIYNRVLTAGEVASLAADLPFTDTDTVAITVTAVNDAPTFTVRDGVVTTSLSSGNDVAYGVVVQPDGKILVSGSANYNTALTRYNADGTLDMSFGGGDGIVLTALSSGSEGRSVTLQPDGKILVTGLVGSSAHVVRYNADGTLDTSFGGGDGVATFFMAGPGNNTGYAVAVQPDGRILVGGSNDNGSSSSNYMLTRLLSDGTLDPSFGTGGSLITALSVAPEDAYAITLQPDGKILLTGRAYYTGDYTVLRYHSDGSLDTSFGGGDGVANYLLNLGSAYATSVVLQPDGKIILAGAGSDIGLLRLQSDGSLDTSFGGGDGIVTQSVMASGVDLGIALLQPDGKIIVAGSGGAGAANDVFAAMRFNADGTLDTSFGTGGLVTTAVSEGPEYARAATLQADGKIVVVGTSYNGSDYDQAMVRYTTDGTPDLSFGTVKNTLNGTPTYTEGGSPVVLDADVQIVDAELTAANNFNGATLTLTRNGGASSDDVFSATGTLSLSSGNIIVSGTNIGTYTNSSGTLAFTFNGNATNTLVNSAIRQIAYSNNSDAPPASVQINWTFNDGNTGSQGSGGTLSATGSVAVNITAVNDAPTITSLSGDSLSYSEGGGTVVIEQGGNALVADVDSANLDTGTLTVSIPSGGDSAEDVLSIRSQGTSASQIGVSGSTITYGGVTIGTFTGGSSGSALVITLNANATPTVVTALIKNITYENTDTDAPTTGARTVRFVLTDGDGGTSANYDMTVTVSGINDAPTFTVGDGIVTTNVFLNEAGEDVVVQPDGKILVVGTSGSPSGMLVTRYNTDGSLDTSFGGGDGIYRVPAAVQQAGYALTVQADGKILLTGFSYPSSQNDFLIVRLNADGSPDTSFGGGDGIVTTDLGLNEVATTVVLQVDGKIVVGGYQAGAGGTDFMIARYNTDGSLDTSFGGGDGVAITSFGGTDADIATSLVVQADGKIVAAGHGGTYDLTLVRYNSDGSLDAGFGTGGLVTTNVGGGLESISGLVVQADGKLVAAGYSGTDMVFVRYNSDGSLDTSLGGTGIVVTSLGAGTSGAFDLALQSDGKIVLTGRTNTGSNYDVVVARYNSDGTLDTNFGGGDGIVTTAIGSGGDEGLAVAIQSDGKIVVSGKAWNGTDYDITLLRYNTDGSLDTQFDTALTSTLNGTPTYTEGGSPVVLDADVRIFDAELSALNNFNGATLTLARNGGANAEDQLVFDGTVVTVSGPAVSVSGVQVGTYTFTGGEMAISFNGNATQARVNTLMQHILYSNVSNTPPASAQIDWIFNDGNGGVQGSGGALQATGSATVTIISTNDVPTDIIFDNAITLNNGPTDGYVGVTQFNYGQPASTQLTFEISFSATSIPSGDLELISYALSSASDNEINAWIEPNGDLWFWLGRSTAPLFTGYNAASLIDGSQHQLSFTWDSATGDTRFYADGTQVGATTYHVGGSIPWATGAETSMLVFGQDQDAVGGGFDSTQIFTGNIFEVRLFTDVRTAPEIAAHVNTYLPNPSADSNLLGNWRMSNNGSGLISDLAGNHDLTLYNAVSLNSAFSVVEGASNGTHVVSVVKVADVDVGDSHTFSLTDSAGGAFAINPTTGEITVANTSLIDHETATVMNITVRATDSSGAFYEEVVPITIVDANEPSVNTVPGPQNVVEDTSLTVWGLSVNDVDGNLSTVQLGVDNGTVSVSLAGGATISAGANGTNTLTLSGTQTEMNAALATLRYQGDLNYTGADALTVTSTDSNGVTDIDTVAITVTAVNDAPIISTGNLVADGSFENGGSPWRSNSVFEVSNSTGSYGITAPPDGGYFLEVEGWSYTGAPSWIEQTISTVAGKTYQFTVAAVTRNNFNVGDMGTLSVDGTQVLAFTTGSNWSDFTTTFVATSSVTTIRITSAGSASGYTNPGDGTGLVVDNVRVVESSPVTFIENGSAVVLTSAGSVFDAELSAANNFSGTTLTLARSSGADAEDVFSATGSLSLSGGNVTVSGTTIGTYTNSGGSLVFTFNNNATNALVNSAIQQITYSNSNDTPPASVQINWTFNDGNSGAQGTGGAVQVTGSTTVNITAVNDAPALSLNTGSTAVEGGTDIIASNELAVTDGDSSAAQLTYSIGAGPVYGRLELTTAPGVSASTFTQADIDANRLVYVHDGSETTSDSFTFTVSDGVGGTLGATTMTLTITPVNDAPTITSDGGAATASVNVMENVSAVTIVTSADVDLPGQAVTYTINGGADQALFAINTATGALSFTAPPNFEAATDANGDNVYVVQVQVTDSQGASATQTIQVRVTDVAEGLPPTPTIPPTIPPVLLPTAPSGQTGLGSGTSSPLGPTKPSTEGPSQPPVAPGSGSTSLDFHPTTVVPSPMERQMVVKPEEPREAIDIVKDSGLLPWSDEPTRPFYADISVEPTPTPESEPDEASQSVSDLLLSKLDEMTVSLEKAMGVSQEQHIVMTRIAAMTGTTLSAGFIAWALRSGTLLASFMATMPAWRHFDPLPVLGGSRSERERRRQEVERDRQAEATEFKGLKHLLDLGVPHNPKP